MVINTNIQTGGTFQMGFGNQEQNIGAEMGIVNATSDNYNDLANKPAINNVELVGNKSPKELDITEDKSYVHYQRIASKVWNVKHDMGKFPSVSIIDSANTVVVGEIQYIDENTVTITFTSGFSGKAICN